MLGSCCRSSLYRFVRSDIEGVFRGSFTVRLAVAGHWVAHASHAWQAFFCSSHQAEHAMLVIFFPYCFALNSLVCTILGLGWHVLR